MATLLFKVGALALRTLAKPLGERFQRWILTHPVARTRVIKTAQALHKVEVYITRGAEGKTGKAFVGEMTEEKSVQLAAKIASEGFVFGVGVLVLAFEYDRTRRKEVAKKLQEDKERAKLREAARQERERLVEENRQQQEMLQNMMDRIVSLEQLVTVLQEQEQKQLEKAAVQEKPRRTWGGFFSANAASI